MKHDWEYKKLRDVCNSTSNIQWSKEDKSYSYVDLTSVDRESYCITETSSVNKDNAPSRAKQWIKTGDVLFGTTRPLLKRVCLIDESYDNQVCSTGFSVLRPSDSLIPKWVFYQLLSDRFYTYIEPLQTGITYPAVSDKDVRSFVIPVPPIDEQKAICSLLDKMNRVVEAKKEQLKELDNLAQAIFYDMFGDPTVNDKCWQMKKLCEVGEIVAGSTPSTNDSENWDGDVNWVTPAELGKQLFYGSTQRKLTQKGSRGLTLMPVGTVLLSSRAPIGKLAITTEPMCCNQGFKNVICNDCLNNIFLYHYLLYTMEKVQALGVGATFKEVSKKAISGYMTILPPLNLQQAFAEKVKAIERQKELINQSIKDVQTLFDAKMDYYFGE